MERRAIAQPSHPPSLFSPCVDDEGDDDQDQDLSAKLNELRGMMGSFYPFGTQNQYTSVDLVLSKEDFELEELLELDDFLPDLRRGKSNLLS
jgi:hypothetical protein